MDILYDKVEREMTALLKAGVAVDGWGGPLTLFRLGQLERLVRHTPRSKKMIVTTQRLEAKILDLLALGEPGTLGAIPVYGTGIAEGQVWILEIGEETDSYVDGVMLEVE